MEAEKQRAALRLLAAGGGLILTAGLVIATVVVSMRREPTPRLIAVDQPLVSAPAWREISEDTVAESYRLPISLANDSSLEELPEIEQSAETQVDDTEWTQGEADADFVEAAPDSQQPSEENSTAARATVTVETEEEAVEEADSITAESIPPVLIYPALTVPEEVAISIDPPPVVEREESQPKVAKRFALFASPMTPHNPAAMGPPEDDSIPALQAAIEPISSPTSQGESETSLVLDSQALSQDAHSLLSYTASLNEISERLTPDVQSGFLLGKSGAVYAARGRFVSVLRQLALAKDAEEGTNRHARALAEGLRTLDEADDFIPRGDALEAELDVNSIARSHGVDLLEEETVSPHEAVAIYSRHAAQQLAEAANGEQAGSMALYGLGKTYGRLEAQSDDSAAGRKSMVMYQAALLSHSENYLAANELGVRLARVGRYEQAQQVLRQAASKPSAPSTVFENLAAVDQKLGLQASALAAAEHSEQLSEAERATGEISRRRGIEWVSPDAFRRPQPGTIRPAPAQQAANSESVPSNSTNVAQQTTPSETTTPSDRGGSRWSRMVNYAKQATGWSEPAAEPMASEPMMSPSGSNQASVPQQRVLR